MKISKKENLFKYNKNIIQNTEYQILTSNSKVKHYEKLNYQITTVKDQYPTITVNNAPDSLHVDKNVIIGQVSDDIGLHKLQIVYYPQNNDKAALKSVLPVKKDVFDQFIFTFPGNLPVEEGVSYEYYFEVFDNDALHNFKSSKSSTFSNRINTEEERQDEQLKQQNDNINSLQKSLKNQDKQRYEGYRAEYERVNLGGITCDGQDYYNQEAHVGNVFMPKTRKVQFLGFFHTGAYQEVLSGYGGIHHCLLPSPKHVIIRRNRDETFNYEVFGEEQNSKQVMKILGYI